jgi:AraC-like DNA-binding protein
MRNDILQIRMTCPIKAQNAGLFISRGNAMHPTRIIDSHELIFVIQGKLDMWEGEQEFHLTPGRTLHLWPGRKHGSSKPMPPDLKFYWIHFEIEDINSEADLRDSETLIPVIAIPQTAQPAHPEALERLFRIFLNEQETGKLRPLSANLLTMLMLVEVERQSRRRVDNDDLNAVATWAHTYIRMNFDRPITAGKVAMALGYNADYLGRIYRQTYGCTLTDAIHRRRVNKACEGLLNSNLPINLIASRCGFNDSDYFRRIFKRYMQITPSEYREENSRLHVITH